MKVKIGDTYYDSADIPIMVVFDQFDKSMLEQMFRESPDNDRYMAFRTGQFESVEQAKAWMADQFKVMTG